MRTSMGARFARPCANAWPFSLCYCKAAVSRQKIQFAPTLCLCQQSEPFLRMAFLVAVATPRKQAKNRANNLPLAAMLEERLSLFKRPLS